MMAKEVGEPYHQKPVIGSDNAVTGWHCTATWFRAKVRCRSVAAACPLIAIPQLLCEALNDSLNNIYTRFSFHRVNDRDTWNFLPSHS